MPTMSAKDTVRTLNFSPHFPHIQGAPGAYRPIVSEMTLRRSIHDSVGAQGAPDCTCPMKTGSQGMKANATTAYAAASLLTRTERASRNKNVTTARDSTKMMPVYCVSTVKAAQAAHAHSARSSPAKIARQYSATHNAAKHWDIAYGR